MRSLCSRTKASTAAIKRSSGLPPAAGFWNSAQEFR
jgi:hypothetical protein